MVSSVHTPDESYAERAKKASQPKPTSDAAPDLAVQLALLDEHDDHDPFVVRVPPHLSRQSSSTDARLPPDRQHSTASFRHHALRLARALSQSPSHSRAHSRSGSSASSPRLQIRGRALPPDDTPPDLRLDPLRPRSSPALPDPPAHLLPDPADPSFYRRPLDMPHYNPFVQHYTTTQHFAHAPGHTSPPYIPHSGQGTPPYYPPYPAYMYPHPSLYWGDTHPPHSHTHFHNQHLFQSNYINASEHPVPHTPEFGSTPPTLESGTSKDPTKNLNGWQPRSYKNVVFGTINLPESASTPPPNEEQQPTDPAIDQATEQFATFSIGIGPNEPGPSRLSSRRPSVRSLFNTLSQSFANDNASAAPQQPREPDRMRKPVKWEFGTTHSQDIDASRPASPPSPPPTDHQGESGSDDRPVPPPIVAPLRTKRPMNKAVTVPPPGDVWVVKDYGYGFGEQSGSGKAPEVVRWEMREREKERARELDREVHRDRSWPSVRQPSWRHENGNEDTRDGWEQQVHVDAPRHVRPRRGSLPGYGGHERGGFPARRGRGLGGRFQGGRGRGGFFHQRPGSYPFAPPPPPPLPPPPPFEVIPPIDMVNGYSQPSFVPQEIDPASQSLVPFTSPNYPVEAMRNLLLGQLEYYLSPQNMAQDFYLRQRMDNEGWIPISLLASFKRVQQLHTDADIVREVLSRSPMVEVNGDWARMARRQWEVFVLPNAPRSVVTAIDHGEDKSPVGFYHDGGAHTDPEEIEGDCDGEDCEGDDEDDDVEFVIGEEAEGSWMSVAERKQ